MILFNIILVLLLISKGNSYVSDAELAKFSEELLSKDHNNLNKYVKIYVQGRTTGNSTIDQAPNSLLNIDRELYNIPTIKTLFMLYDNYIADVSKAEILTTTETSEEINFINALFKTDVMRHLKAIINEKGLLPPRYTAESLIKEIWFTMYPRSGRNVGSSAFEHIFLGEIKNNEVSGLHNWLYFHSLEKNNEINYLGWIKKIEFSGNKGSILKIHFLWKNHNKPVGTMFTGTSPELELSLYTLCYLTRPSNKCKLKLGGKDITIQTYPFKYNGKTVIGSAYPLL